jgi:hypothetical protein
MSRLHGHRFLVSLLTQSVFSNYTSVLANRCHPLDKPDMKMIFSLMRVAFMSGLFVVMA